MGCRVMVGPAGEASSTSGSNWSSLEEDKENQKGNSAKTQKTHEIASKMTESSSDSEPKPYPSLKNRKVKISNILGFEKIDMFENTVIMGAPKKIDKPKPDDSAIPEEDAPAPFAYNKGPNTKPKRSSEGPLQYSTVTQQELIDIKRYLENLKRTTKKEKKEVEESLDKVNNALQFLMLEALKSVNPTLGIDVDIGKLFDSYDHQTLSRLPSLLDSKIDILYQELDSTYSEMGEELKNILGNKRDYSSASEYNKRQRKVEGELFESKYNKQIEDKKSEISKITELKTVLQPVISRLIPLMKMNTRDEFNILIVDSLKGLEGLFDQTPQSTPSAPPPPPIASPPIREEHTKLKTRKCTVIRMGSEQSEKTQSKKSVHEELMDRIKNPNLKPTDGLGVASLAKRVADYSSLGNLFNQSAVGKMLERSKDREAQEQIADEGALADEWVDDDIAMKSTVISTSAQKESQVTEESKVSAEGRSKSRPQVSKLAARQAIFGGTKQQMIEASHKEREARQEQEEREEELAAQEKKEQAAKNQARPDESISKKAPKTEEEHFKRQAQLRNSRNVDDWDD